MNKKKVVLAPVVAGALLLAHGGAARADEAWDQYCRAATVTVAPIKAAPFDAEWPIYVVPAGTSLWVLRPAVNHYLRTPVRPPPDRYGWIREDHVRILSCLSRTN